ncbi:MAG: c-type cytochrome [Bacteroidetes bacterium]|nr:c-type cytochrome [Bacteroidota bacterium]
MWPRLFVLLILLTACGVETEEGGPTPASPSVPRNFPPVPVPGDNLLTQEKFELGRQLFFDKAFAKDYSVSCGSCHQPAAGFADGGKAVSTGFHGLTGTRNAPGLTNTAYLDSYLWEGGVPTLEKQALAPIVNPVEFNIHPDTLVMRIAMNPVYPPQFEEAFGSREVTLERITKSIATFERFLISGNSEFDKWNRGEPNQMTASAKRGFDVFFGESGDCFHCHVGFNFTDNDFHNNSLAAVYSDPGRYLLTSRDEDIGKFKTPTLRNVALTAPYMHDGSIGTLEEVVRHYNSGGKHHPNADILMRPLGLKEDEMADLVAFLESLTDTSFTNQPNLQPPD